MSARTMPVVVACTGHAIAAGALLLLGADERIGARGAFRHRPDRDRSSAWCCRGGRSSSRRSGSSPRHLQVATVGAAIYDPDGAVDAGFLDEVVDPEALADARRSRGPALGRPARATPTAARCG